MEEVFIVAAARTAVGNFMGTLANIPANVLGGKVIDAVLQRAGVKLLRSTKSSWVMC